MSQRSPQAGTPAPASVLVDLPRLLTAYYAIRPDPALAAHQVVFGTSGHRGKAMDGRFNESQVLAISQAICNWRRAHGIDGPLFLGFDTHALSFPAFVSTLEVLAANQVLTVIAAEDEYTPTPAISHAIVVHNRGRSSGLADGIVITPSHNPPETGGNKYNASHGGPAQAGITDCIQAEANRLLKANLQGVRRIGLAAARCADTTRQHDFLGSYVAELDQVVDLAAIRAAGVRMGVDPLGGAGVHYWPRIAEHYGLDLQIVRAEVDASFRFMSLDWDGQIRIDPSSPDAMQGLIGLKDRFDVAFANDPDHDRHGIVVPGAGLLPPNHYLGAVIEHLFWFRPAWSDQLQIGKTVVSSSQIDRISARLGRRLFEVPVGFKWFVPGLQDASLGFAGEESAGASLLRRDGRTWTTDKDGIALALLAGEICARQGHDPGESCRRLGAELGQVYGDRVDAFATDEHKAALARMQPARFRDCELGGEAVIRIEDRATGNNAPIGGIKLHTAGGWIAARPSGTEALYKIYAESYRDPAHLHLLLADAQTRIDCVLQNQE